MNEVEDAQLLERSRRGDEGAFSELYRRYQAGIYRYAVHMCGTSAGDDVVQETFLAVLGQRRRTDAPRRTVAGYLFGIARHIVLQRLICPPRGGPGADAMNAGQRIVIAGAAAWLVAARSAADAQTQDFLSGM